MIRFKDLAFGALLGLGLCVGAALADDSTTRLFPDSTIVSRDRFSDEIVGNGPDLILIHGLASSRATWAAAAERLKAHYRLHLIQIAGFAGEPARANGSGEVLVPTAEAIDAYLVEQHLTPATVIGHSLGGTMALYLAEHHGDHLKKILIVDSLPLAAVIMGGPGATVESIKPFADQLRASTATAPNQDAMLARLVTSPANLATVAAWSNASDHGAVNRALADDLLLDLRPGLASLSVPLTLLYPDNGAPAMVDPFYHGAYAAVPHKTLIRIDNSRHYITFDQPAQFDAALDAFLKD